MDKALRSVIVVFLFLGWGIHLSGQVLLFDNFDYPSGSLLTDHNWIQQQTTSTNPVLTATAGLTYSGYLLSGIGLAAAVGPEGQDVFRGFVKQTLPGTSVYMAAMVKVTAAATGDAFLCFKESPTSTTNSIFRGRIYAKIDGGNVAFGISKGAISAPASANYTPSVYSLNTTYLLIMKYKIIEGTTTPNDSAFLFVNPVINAPEPAPSAVATDISASDVGIGSVLLRQGTAGSSPTVIVDGIRVAKSWQTVLNISDIATLSDLKADGMTVTGFSPDIYHYNDTVPAGQTSVVIASTASCWAATQVVSVTPAIPGTTTIVVTAENGINTKTYTVSHAYNYFQVSVGETPAGAGTVSGGGTYGQGFQATISATEAPGYLFFNWTENGVTVSGSPVYTFTVIENHNFVANFIVQNYAVVTTANPLTGGTITGAGFYPVGTNVTLTAIANTGYIFNHWEENGVSIGTNPTLILQNLSVNHDITGFFEQSSTSFTISVSPNPANGGTVTGSGNFQQGTNDTLRATPAQDFKFDKWTENGTTIGTTPELILTNIQANRTIVGHFTSTVGVGENQGVTFKVYPNPAADLLHVESGEEIQFLELLTVQGIKVKRERVDSATGEIRVSNLPAGIYLLRITHVSGTTCRRVLIEK